MAKSDPQRRLVINLRMILDILEDQMRALRDLIDAITPYASVLDESSVRFAGLRQIIRGIPRESMPKVRDILSRAAEAKIRPAQAARELFEKFEGQGWNYELIVALHEASMRQPRLPILRNSLLTAAVASFEATVANVATEFYHYRPEALEMDSRDHEKEFSLKELKQFSSIDDAVDFSISRRIESLVFGGLSDWRCFFNDALKIDLSTLAIDWPELQEILQRRHAIVHNGGRASRRYIAQVRLGRPDVKIPEGEPLSCEQEYLEYAIDHLLVAGALLITAVIIKFSPDDAPSSELSRLAYSLLRGGRLEATRRLCDFGMNMPIEQDEALIFKVNMALAIKAKLGIEGIAEEMGSWDVSALSDRFKLAKASLLGNLDEAFMLLSLLVERDEISVEDLLEWPLLAEMRKDRRFTALIIPKVDEAATGMSKTEFVVLNNHSGVIHKPGCRFAKSGTRVQVDEPDARNAGRCKICWR